jgi:glycosyltransferase involved in cell wall biosynthesis
MSVRPHVTLVIPMRNAGATIGGLAESLRSIDALTLEVIVVDDASTDDSVPQLQSLELPRCRVIQSGQQQGAGIARNRGFAEATGTYTLFFDADDEIHAPALVTAVTALEDSGADVAFLSYRYRRGHSTEFEGMNSYDQTVWTRYASRLRTPCSLTDVPQLLGFSNYPWNKVIRTDRYHQTGLRFGGTPVHNDILGHWMTLLDARTLVLLDDPLCTHIVAEGASNLTNYRSQVRLTLFDALDETYTFLEEHPAQRNRFSHHYWDFALRVSGWAAGRIDAEHRDEFNVRLQNHLLRMNLVDFSRIRQRRDPGLANRILRRALV